MTAIPGPDATREEVDRFREDARATAQHRRRSDANRWQNSVCTSCGQQGHRMGARACENYGSSNRWVQRRFQRGGNP